MKRSFNLLTFLIVFLMVIFPIKIEAKEVEKRVNAEEVFYQSNKGLVINPLWEEYEELSEDEKANWGYVPTKYILEYKESINNLITPSYGTLDFADTLPSKYDLRDVSGTNYTTPVKDQGSLGLCWAFASNSSVETNLLKEGLRTNSDPALFSERQIDYISTKPTNNKTILGTLNINPIREGYNPYLLYSRELGSGGNFIIASQFFGLGFSPVDTDDVWQNYNESFNTYLLSQVFDAKKSYTVTDFFEFPVINNNTASESAKELWREKIKKHVMNYGSVYVGTLAPQTYTSGSCYVEDTGSGKDLIYWNDSCEKTWSEAPYDGTHAMSIIGWDDDYSASYCAYKDGTTSTEVDEEACTTNDGKWYTSTGAWILKNSWGPYTPYTYLSYNSKINEVSGVVKTIEKDFDNVYSMFGPSLINLNGVGSTINTFYKNKSTEKLKRVSFEISRDYSGVWGIYYINKIGKTKTLGTVTTTESGRYSLDVDNLEIEDEVFQIEVAPLNGADASMVNIYAYTLNTNKNIEATTIINKNYSEINNKFRYIVDTRATNTVSGSRISYNIIDRNGNTVASNASSEERYIAGGIYNGYLYTDQKLNDDIYYIETYIDGILSGTDTICFETSLTGKGTSANPYIIDSYDDFEYMTTRDYSTKTFKLANDIDLSGISNFKSIGTGLTEVFSGVLDGENYKIVGLNQNTEKAGLFERLNGATVQNLKINANMEASSSGGLLAAETNNVTIENIQTEGTLTGSSSAYLGGIVGIAKNTTINKSYNYATLRGGKIGAFVGKLSGESTLSDSFNIGEQIGSNPALTSIAADIAPDVITLHHLIDFASREYTYCPSHIDYDLRGITVDELYYYGNCKYIGEEVKDADLKNTQTFKNFSKSIWQIESGKYPTLIDSGFHFIEKLTPKTSKDKNIFVGDTFDLTTEIAPTNATYTDLKINVIDNSNLVTVNGTRLTAISSGIVTIKVDTKDSSHISQNLNLFIFPIEFKNKLIENKYYYIKDEIDSTEAFSTLLNFNNICTSDKCLTISLENDEYIGTGNKFEYKIDDNVVGEFTAIVKGDLSGDGIVASNDILLMRRYLLELDTLDKEQTFAGDFNGNGISSANMLQMRRYILGYEGEL